MADTYYQSTRVAPFGPGALRGSEQASVCIIGGGFAGLNTALGCAERGKPGVVLLESKTIGYGASGRNGGFVFGGFSRSEASLLADLGESAAAELYRDTRDAVTLIKRRVHDYRIDCGLEADGVVLANWFRDPQVLRARQQLLRQHFATDWRWLDKQALDRYVMSDRYSAGLLEAEAAQIHPLNYCDGLGRAAAARGVRLFDQSPAIKLERRGRGWCVHTSEGRIEAEQVVLSCGGYLAGLVSAVDRAVMPIATYVMVTEPLGGELHRVLPTQACIYDTRFAFDYYRPLTDSRLLWGGRISIKDRSPNAVKELLRRDLGRVFPHWRDARIDFAWSGLMSYATHEMPQIGQVEPGLWVAQAFGGHGVAPTTLAGELLAAALCEGDNRWQRFARYGFSPTFRPAGLWGAQLTYWWLQAQDAWRDWRESRSRH
ncbi:NAD(P)/FAD-dependent oxidoreductase [Pseudomarimonas arenosa]|uniref:FAD-binding oxidoreductase n=1 Tax=Pseudomarimonas arenosa TaxID=2774145 RepID=A0AAW3ZGY5_9GAMM|nr:FAD-binding oxidoreductase [Pseudomarimonas arenosa]MBD8525286.1 FAD-binding oxidoreductase [Pseudomarimonas arenosa]